ncbi:MAG: VanW family protein [Clostridia bacterium]|nr:VanW family protein [Clostridia bacterium]
MEKKSVRNYLNIAIVGVVAALLSLGILFAFLISRPAQNDIQDLEEITLENVLNSKYFQKYPNASINLSFGEKNFQINSNPAQNLQNITEELYIAPQDAKVVFDPTSDEVFVFQEEVIGQEVDVNNLALYIRDNILSKSAETIAIPTNAIAPKITKKDLEGLVQLRSQFSTSIVGSEPGRKHNVQYALKAFNGLIVMPDEEVSFNKTTGERTFNSQYRDATIISGGKYVQGRGGGVCQASTTLYNALIRADLEILQVQNHSLPVKYVPLAFDAMVNDTTSDLIFKNNTESPIYFLTGGDDENVWVKIFGAPMPAGLTIETRTETVREIKKGDNIIPDTNGEYANHITFKGEYYRIKYPQNGKECVGYLQYFQDGKLIEEKKVRHAYYQGQEGIIMEGTEDVYDGVTLPESNVDFITGN